jgi:hypothetical protein
MYIRLSSKQQAIEHMRQMILAEKHEGRDRGHRPTTTIIESQIIRADGAGLGAGETNEKALAPLPPRCSSSRRAWATSHGYRHSMPDLCPSGDDVGPALGFWCARNNTQLSDTISASV